MENKFKVVATYRDLTNADAPLSKENYEFGFESHARNFAYRECRYESTMSAVVIDTESNAEVVKYEGDFASFHKV